MSGYFDTSFLGRVKDLTPVTPEFGRAVVYRVREVHISLSAPMRQVRVRFVRLA
jgi:hypothetical protein